jgi:hypothetical protein
MCWVSHEILARVRDIFDVLSLMHMVTWVVKKGYLVGYLYRPANAILTEEV